MMEMLDEGNEGADGRDAGGGEEIGEERGERRWRGEVEGGGKGGDRLHSCTMPS